MISVAAPALATGVDKAMAQKLVVPVTFQIYQGDTLVRTETIAQNVIKIGKDQKSHLRIDDDSVSRMHAVIEAKPEEVQVIDLVSSTFVNGQPVNKCGLKSGDEIRLGNTRLIIELGQPVDAAALAPSAPAQPVPSVPPVGTAPVASVPPAGMYGAPAGAGVPPMTAGAAFAGHGGHGHGHGHEAGGASGEEIYQLVKRGDINPSEVEESRAQAVEVSILWKSSILHVAHIDKQRGFELAQDKDSKQPTGPVMGGLLALGSALVTASGVTGKYAIGAVGTAFMMSGMGAGIFFDDRKDKAKTDVARFVVGPEMLQGLKVARVIVPGSSTRFVFLPGATGEVEIDGAKRTLQELIDGGLTQPSRSVPGGYEIEMRPNGRYRMELGGLTVLAKVVPPGRKVAGGFNFDPALAYTFGGTFAVIAAGVVAMRVAVADDSGFLSQGNDEDRLAELRAFVQRQQERQPEQQPQPETRTETQQEGGTGTRHAGAEGKMGNRQSTQTNRRYAINNNGEPPHLSRQAAREAVATRGIFAALGAPGGAAGGGASGIVSPFGGLTESGLDNQNANGNMTGDSIGEAGGFGGLGTAGTGWGGGGTGEGTVGMGNFGTMGHGSGNGTGQGFGSGAGRGLRGRGTQGPLVRAAPPEVSGLLSPEAIRRVVLRNLGQVSHCHEQGLAQNPNLEGRVVIRFIIGGTGTVLGAAVAESTVPVPSVGQCISQAVRRWQFPAPEGGGTVTVNYPFNLQHPEGG